MSAKDWKATYNGENSGDLRKLQLAELDMMKMFSEICDRNGLRYYMVGGTMLGAVRHKGFVPWDDDMDVGMPRPDYERFIEIARENLPEGYAFLNYKLDPSYHRYFSRIINKNVAVHNASNTKVIVENAWLDIFPFDGMPSRKWQQKIHFWHVTFLRFLYHASCFDELVNLNRPGRPRYLQAVIRFLSITHFGSGFDTIKLMRKVEKELLRYSYDDCRYMVSMFGSYMEKEIVNKKLLGKGRPYQFEDTTFNGPVKGDAFLRHFYGDYMQPPKDADKDKHNILKIEFDGKPEDKE
ncbi:MAG: LicD family protein [Lachnospiraceae bacterium]|nr:LicD family protein [Lachnospiraceae bacterium]